MSLLSINSDPKFEANPDLEKAAFLYQSLLDAIAKKEVPKEILERINEHTIGINAASGTPKELVKIIKKHQSAILKTLERECKMVPQGHYQTLFMILGMTAFGVPLGVAFGTAIGNLAFLGIGLPIGMTIGIAIGNSKDKKAEESGLQLDWKAT